MRHDELKELTVRLGRLLQVLREDNRRLEELEPTTVDWCEEPQGEFERRLRAATLERWARDQSFVRAHRLRNGAGDRPLAADAQAFVNAELAE